MSSRLLLWFVLTCLSAGAARDAVVPPPDPAVVAAEHQRLSDELQRLVERQVWVGAEDRFRACEALGVPLTFQDLLNGAHAARGQGDARASYERLRRAATLEASRQVVDWLWDLDTGYGKVVLTTNPPKGVDLKVEALPFAPDRRAAVEFAIARLKSEGRFEGLLPLGNYTIGDIPFKVDADVAIQIEVSSRKPKVKEPRAPSPQEAPQPIPQVPPEELPQAPPMDPPQAPPWDTPPASAGEDTGP